MTLIVGKEVTVSPHYDQSGKSLYYSQQVVFQGENQKLHGTNRSQILRLGTVADLELEHPENPDSGLREYIRTAWGPNNTPVYIFDDHNHALFGWFETFKEGRIRFAATLLHLDAHPDDKAGPGRLDLTGSLEQAAQHIKGLEVGEFIEPAERCGLVGRYQWIFNSTNRFPSRQTIPGFTRELLPFYHDIEQVSAHLKEKKYDPRDLIVNIDADFFPSIDEGKDVRALAVIRQAMSMAGVITIATSPGYIPAGRAFQLVCDLLAPY